jgi:hypothetical protein
MVKKVAKGRGSLVGLASLAFVLSLPILSHGWGNTWMGIALEQTISSLTRSVGPIKVDASFRLTNGGYDSNLYFGSSGDRVDDITFRVGPDIRLYWPLQKSLILEVRESPQYSFFVRTRSERAWNNVLNGVLHLVFKNLYGRFSFSSMNLKERLNTEVYVNIRRKEDQGQGLLLWQMSKGLSVELQLGTSRRDFEDVTYGTDNVRANLNRTERMGSLTAYIQGGRRLRFHLTGAFGEYRFPLASTAKDSNSAWISTGLEFLGTGGVQGRIDLGYKLFDVLAPERQDYQGPVGDVRLAVRVMRLTELAVLVQRNVNFAVYTDRSYYVQTLLGAELTRQISKQSRFSYTFSHGQNRYALDPASGDVGPERPLFRFFLHSASLLVRLQKNLDLTLRGNWIIRTRNWSVPEDHRSFYGLDLDYRF